MIDVTNIYTILLDYSLKNPGIFVPYLKENIPEKFHYSNNERISPIVLICNSSSYITTTSGDYTIGAHGYDVDQDDSMNALFIAHGGKILNSSLMQTSLNSFCNVEIFSLLLELLSSPAVKLKGGFIPIHTHNGTNYLARNILLES